MLHVFSLMKVVLVLLFSLPEELYVVLGVHSSQLILFNFLHVFNVLLSQQFIASSLLVSGSFLLLFVKVTMIPSNIFLLIMGFLKSNVIFIQVIINKFSCVLYNLLLFFILEFQFVYFGKRCTIPLLGTLLIINVVDIILMVMLVTQSWLIPKDSAFVLLSLVHDVFFQFTEVEPRILRLFIHQFLEWVTTV